MIIFTKNRPPNNDVCDYELLNEITYHNSAPLSSGLFSPGHIDTCTPHDYKFFENKYIELRSAVGFNFGVDKAMCVIDRLNGDLIDSWIQ